MVARKCLKATLKYIACLAEIYDTLQHVTTYLGHVQGGVTPNIATR